MYQFTCPRCGKEGVVPFEPSNPDRILCSDCHEETGGKTFDLSRASKAPRRRYNTRVSIQIVCASCGKHAELDYAPKGIPLQEMKCSDCVRSEKGNLSRWSMIQELKEREQRLRGKRMFALPCAACGTETELPFRPEEGKEYYCSRCYANDGVVIDFTRREEPTHVLAQALFVRKGGAKKKIEEMEAQGIGENKLVESDQRDEKEEPWSRRQSNERRGEKGGSRGEGRGGAKGGPRGEGRGGAKGGPRGEGRGGAKGGRSVNQGRRGKES